jgi:hypothetical protein
LPSLKNESELWQLSGLIECDKPNIDLYEFSGKALVNKKEMYFYKTLISSFEQRKSN